MCNFLCPCSQVQRPTRLSVKHLCRLRTSSSKTTTTPTEPRFTHNPALTSKHGNKNVKCPVTQVQIMPAGAETTIFKDFFRNWMDKDEITGPGQTYTVGKIARVQKIPFDSSSLHNNKAMAAQHGMVDDGSGKVQVG